MTHNGWANSDTYYFDMFWSNNETLYKAIVSEGKRLLEWMPSMTDQTLGVNILDALKAAVDIGGWGYSTVPAAFESVPRKTLAELAVTVTLANVNETEFGAAVREAIG